MSFAITFLIITLKKHNLKQIKKMIKVISLLFIAYLVLNMTNRFFKMQDLDKFKSDQLKKIEELQYLKSQSNALYYITLISAYVGDLILYLIVFNYLI